MSTNTEELLRKLSDKIAEIYDREFAREEFTGIFVVLVSRLKNTSKRYWSLVKKLAACEKERDELRRIVEKLEGRGRDRDLACTWTLPQRDR